MSTAEVENLTINATIHRFGIGRTRLYELIGSGEIEAIKLGRRTLIPAESLRAYFDNLPRMTPSKGGRHD